MFAPLVLARTIVGVLIDSSLTSGAPDEREACAVDDQTISVEMIEPPPYYEERDKSQFKVSTRKINDGPLTTG